MVNQRTGLWVNGMNGNMNGMNGITKACQIHMSACNMQNTVGTSSSPPSTRGARRGLRDLPLCPSRQQPAVQEGDALAYLVNNMHVQLLGFKRLLTINICLFILFVLPHAHTIYPHTCLYCELQALNAHTVYPPTCPYCSPLVCKSLSPRTSASGSCPMGSAAATTLPVRPLGDDIVSGFADS